MDSLGSEAIIWYFLLEQLQIRGNYIPAGRGQGRVSLGTLRPPPTPVLDGGRSPGVSAVASGDGWTRSWETLLSPGRQWSGLGGKVVTRSLTRSILEECPLCSVLCWEVWARKGTTLGPRPQGAHSLVGESEGRQVVTTV